MKSAASTVAVALALLTSAAPARGETASAAEARLEAARSVIRLVTPPDRWDDMVKQMGAQMTGASAAQGVRLPADFQEKLESVLNEAIPYEEMLEWSAEIYAKRFTTKELKDLASFYETPLGRKLARELPGIMGEVGQKMGTLLPKRLPALMKKHGLAP
jgi:hypothetical protein